MQKKKILYQIKLLETLIIRTFTQDIEKIHLTSLPCSLTPTQIQIIEYILDHKSDAIYQRDLEEVLNLRRATVSGVLQTMEKNGLLERVTHDSDARAKKIILNKKSKELFSQSEKKMEEIENVMLQNISREELDIFSKVLLIMKENLIQKNKTSK